MTKKLSNIFYNFFNWGFYFSAGLFLTDKNPCLWLITVYFIDRQSVSSDDEDTDFFYTSF